MRIVCLCGSTRNKAELLAAQEAETLLGNLLVGPVVFSQADGTVLSDEEVERLHLLHRRKIELADELLIVAPGGRIGASTSQEIDFGRSPGKPIRFWEHDGTHAALDPAAALIESHRAQQLVASR